MQKSGFTLFELLIVISIIGVMAAFLAPEFPSAERFSAREEVNKIHLLIEKSRNEALSEGKSFEFHFNSADSIIETVQMISEDVTETQTNEKLTSEKLELTNITLTKVEADRLYEAENFNFKLSAFNTPPSFKAYFEGENSFVLISNGTHAPLKVEPFYDEK